MSTEILFVDDDPDILAGFQRSLRKELKIDTAVGGAAALAMMRGREPYSVVVADMQMPGMNGVEFLKELERTTPDTVRIMLTGNADQKTARDAVNHGHIFRFLTKPCPQEDLVPALRAGLKHYQLVTAERDVLEKTLNGSARMLSDILAMHDSHSFGKSQRLRDYMRVFADYLKLKQTWDLELAATLSQIGCVTIPQAVLEKCRAGRPLAGAEADVVRRVPQIGYNLLSHIPRLESVAAVVLYQNKNFDGTGFPFDKVAGEDIPIGARILRVLQDLLEHELAKTPKDKALDSMTRFPGRYDPRVMEAVAALFDVCLARTSPGEAQSRPAGIKNLRIGWILAAEARTRGGVRIVPAGTQISPMLMEKLRNFAELGELEEPMLVTG
ncbi:MAG TPA: HD domain-containing phosphohydrolase [Candidatus Baltobacteraceae bacterium]|jgi:response regulator RpfG family c-di-GMP phosphodiesterase|nr:HD domain-containing phosphohydrolase [Candidatus Baltobacteraceae bacterium]